MPGRHAVTVRRRLAWTPLPPPRRLNRRHIHFPHRQHRLKRSPRLRATRR